MPTAITRQQVREAREIVPVPEAGKAQTGTIVVSTTDAPFSMQNREHVAAANHIEIRLADQDLFPPSKIYKYDASTVFRAGTIGLTSPMAASHLLCGKIKQKEHARDHNKRHMHDSKHARYGLANCMRALRTHP
ncbi:hypothetical protein ACVCIC_24700 [Burkholderia glumae]